MGDIKAIYGRYINEGLTLAVASNSKDVAECAKLRIRPVSIRGGLAFQVTRTVGQKELHENLTADEAVNLLAELTGSLFRQVELKGTRGSLLVMVGKRGTMTVKERKAQTAGTDSAEGRGAAGSTGATDGQGAAGSRGTAAGGGTAGSTDSAEGRGTPAGSDAVAGEGMQPGVLTNNRVKKHLLPEGEPVPFLVELGVMTASGKVVAQRYDKFRQINRYLEFVEDIIPSLPKGREISIIDFGCGKSYLTFALYYYLHEVKGLPVNVTGLDLKKDVIEECSALAVRFGYTGLKFLHGDIADYDGTDSVDMVVTLHACDTATDYALAKAVGWGAKVIFCVPCCQHEVNKTIKNDALASIFKYGLIKERMSALLTDALRANMLEEQGYKTQILEFIDMEHTPKNILIRAVKQPKLMKTAGRHESAEGRSEAVMHEPADYRQVIGDMHINPTLYRLLSDK